MIDRMRVSSLPDHKPEASAAPKAWAHDPKTRRFLLTVFIYTIISLIFIGINQWDRGQEAGNSSFYALSILVVFAFSWLPRIFGISLSICVWIAILSCNAGVGVFITLNGGLEHPGAPIFFLFPFFATTFIGPRSTFLAALISMLSLVAVHFFAGGGISSADGGIRLLTYLGLAVCFSIAVIMFERSINAVRAKLASALLHAEAGNDAKAVFLSIISHELRTPLNGVIGMAEILKHTELDEDQRRLLGVIDGSATGLLSLVNDILDMSRIESGEIFIRNRPYNIKHLAEGALSRARTSDRTRSADLSLAIPEDLHLERVGDPDILRQIFAILLGNALKYANEGPVRFEVEPVSRDILHIFVCDEGPGIPAYLREKVFERFAQVDQSYSRRFGGTGLGLAIARALARQLGGDVDIVEKSGPGTRFRFKLPAPHALKQKAS